MFRSTKIILLGMMLLATLGWMGKVSGRDPDQKPPVLTSPQVEPMKLMPMGGRVTLRVIVKDDEGVVATRADVTKPNRQKETVPLALDDGTPKDGLWGGTFAVPVNASLEEQIYTVAFFAKDAAGNEGRSAEVSFTVEAVVPDTEAPTLYSPRAEPSKLSPMGGNVVLSIIATDNTAVASAQAEVTKPNGSKATVDLSQMMVYDTPNKDLWAGAFIVPMNRSRTEQTYRVTFSARDAANNEAKSGELTFTVAGMVDIKPPGPVPVTAAD
jgi:hypothetical protein